MRAGAASRALFFSAGACAAAASLSAQDTASTLLDRAASGYRSAHTIRAYFEQTLTSSATGAVHDARGEYLQSGGNRFALRFTDPAGDAVVSDGTSLWLYLPSTAKGQVIKMPSAVGTGLDVLSALMASPRANYAIVRGNDETVGGHSTAVFALTPKRGDMPFVHATLWIGRSDALIWQLDAVEQSGLERHVRFTSIRMNAALPRDALTFSVPAGVRVIDQAALFGKKP